MADSFTTKYYELRNKRNSSKKEDEDKKISSSTSESDFARRYYELRKQRETPTLAKQLAQVSNENSMTMSDQLNQSTTTPKAQNSNKNAVTFGETLDPSYVAKERYTALDKEIRDAEKKLDDIDRVITRVGAMPAPTKMRDEALAQLEALQKEREALDAEYGFAEKMDTEEQIASMDKKIQSLTETVDFLHNSNIATLLPGWSQITTNTTNKLEALKQEREALAAEHGVGEFREKNATGLEIAGKAVLSGMGQFNRGVTSTLDFLIPTDFLGEKDPFSRLNEYYSRIGDENDRALAEATADRGKATQIAGEVGAGVVAALPNAILALMSGGSSLGASTLSTSASSTGLLSTAKTAVTGMVKNPMYWTSVAQTLGPSYDEAIASGATEEQAVITAIISTALTSGIEVGGGIETLPANLKNGNANAVYQWVKSMYEEGREEVLQGIVSGITEKAVYDKDKAYFSMTDEDAIVNPGRAAKEFGMGAAVASVLGGGQVGTTFALNALNNRANNKQLAEVGNSYQEYAQELIDEGLTFDKDSSAYKTAQALQKKLDSGKKISDADLGRAVVENERAIQAEEAAQQGATGRVVSDFAERDVTLPTQTNTAPKSALNARKSQVEPGYGEKGKAAYREILEVSNETPEQVQARFTSAYEAGLTELPKNRIALLDSVQETAYNAGRMDRILSMKKDETKSATVWGKSSGLIENNYSAKLDAKTHDTLQTIGKATGTKIIIEDIPAEKNANGYYIDSTGTIHIDSKTEQPIMVVVKHELTHRLQALAPKEYRQYRDYAVQYMSETLWNAGVNTPAEDQRAAYRNASRGKVNLSTEAAMDEMAANLTEKILTDEKALNDFVHHVTQSEETMTLGQKFFQAVRDFLEKIRKLFNGNKAKMNEAAQEEFGATISQLERAEQLWMEAYRAAEKKAQSAKKADNKATHTDSDDDTISYNLKEDDTYAGEGKAENRREFQKRVQGGVYKSRQVRGVAIAYEPARAIDKSYAAERAKRELNSLGVPTFYHKGLEWNDGKRTYRDNGELCCVARSVVGIKIDAVGDGIELAGHEAFHVWYGTDGAKKFIASVLVNEIKSSPFGTTLFTEVANKYVDANSRVTGEDAALLDEEYLATIAGKIHSGKHDADLRAMFEDYDAVKSAWEDLVQEHRKDDVQYSLKSQALQDEINQSMTMQQAKDMVQRAFVLGEVKEWFDGEYKNGDEWLKGEGVDAVAMIVDNEWAIQEKYLNKIQGLMDEDFDTTDILEAYLAGTLTGKQQQDNKPKRLNVSESVRAQDERFYAPKQIEDAKAAYETATQKITSKNRDVVNKARAKVIMFAHTRGAAEELGLTQSDLNKKLSSWARYTAKARETSQRFNAGVADWNKWTGIENSNILTRSTVSNEDLDQLVGEITGDSDGWQRKYIMRTMLALDTHIDYSGLNFEFVHQPDSNRSSVNGIYYDSQRKIRVKYNAPNTVAHEMGHYLDYQWARDVGLPSELTSGIGRSRLTDSDVKQWVENFDKFKDSLTDAADLHSGYTMNAAEVFARFVDKFVRWVNFTANGEQSRSNYGDRNDKFTAQHYIEFVRLLQEKSVLDGKKQQEAQFSLKGQTNLLKKNEQLREVIAGLKEQFKTTEFAKVDKKALDKFTRSLLKDYQSDTDIDEVRESLDKLYTYIANGENGETPAWDEAYSRAYKIAVDVLEGASVVHDEMYQEYSSLRAYLRNTGISFDRRYERDLGGYESLNEFRKANMGRIKIKNDGLPVDVAYQELAGMYPEFFSEEEHTNPADQLLHIEEVLEELRPYEANPFSHNMRENATWLANDIMERFYELPQAKPTFADKAERKLTQQVIKDAKKLEALREQKNKRIAELIEKNREKVKLTQAKEKKKRVEAVKKVKERYQEKEARVSDRRKTSVLKDKINKHVEKISKMLLKPTETSHVPESMRSVVSEFLASLDLTTNRQQEKTINRLLNLQKEYRNIASNESDVEMVVDPDLFDNIDTVLDALGTDGTISLSELGVRDLESLYRVTLAVERSIYSYNRIMVEGKNAEISSIAWDVMDENATDKEYQERNVVAQFAANTVNMDMLNPEDYFIQLGDTMNDLYASIRDGFDQKIRLLARSLDYIVNLTDGVNIKSLSDRKAVATKFKLQSGKTIRLTPAQVMSLYLLNRQPDAQNHIYNGGIKPAPVVARLDKDGRPKVTRTYEVVKVTPEDVADILKSMTPEQKKIADGIGKFFTDYTAEWGNQVSLVLYGYKKFGIENYFPIVSDQNYLKEVFGETTDATLKNMGVTKARVKNATNPIIIEDVFDVYTRQVDQMSSYNAFVIPLTDIQRVYNYKTTDGSVKQSIEKKFGVRATGYFKKLMTDVNGGVRWNGGAQFINEMISRYKQARLGLNLRVVLQQPMAMLRALAVINPKYLAQAMTHKSSADIETIYKYAPIVQWKSWGFFSMDTGKRMKDVILGTKNLSDYTMWAAGKMDEITWKRLWVAAEMETRDKWDDLPVGSDEYYTVVGKRLSKIIDRTQVVDSVLHRSQIMRNPDTYVRTTVSFMNEPFKGYNMVRTAIVQAKNNPSKAASQALFSAGLAYVSSLIAVHLVSALVDTTRGDEDDEEWLEKIIKGERGDEEPKTWGERYLWHFADNVANEPLSMFPYVKDAVSIIQGFDVKRMDMQGFGDLINAARRGLSDKYTTTQKVIDIGSKLGDLFGVPLSNLKREIETVVKNVLAVKDDPMAEYQIDKVLYTITGNKGKYLDTLYKAYKQGDMEVYNEIAEELIDAGLTPSYIESGIRSRAIKDGVSVQDMNSDMFAVGVKPKYEVEKSEPESYTVNSLSGKKYTQFIEDRGEIVDEIISDFERRGFGSLPEETANALLSAAYAYAEETALEEASGGEYESDTAWINKAQDADELGLTVPEYIWLKNEYGATSIGADGVYEAYAVGIDVETYLEFKAATRDMKSDEDGTTKKEKVMDYMDTMGLSQEEYDALLEIAGYKKTTEKSGFGSSFGSGFGSGGFGK